MAAPAVAERRAAPAAPVALEELDEDGRRLQRLLELQGRVDGLHRPKIGDTLRFTRFVARQIVESQRSLAKRAMEPGEKLDDVDTLLQFVDALDVPLLLEFGQILLCTQEELVEDDLDVVWITAGVARWCELVQMNLILKNARRVAAALR